MHEQLHKDPGEKTLIRQIKEEEVEEDEDDDEVVSVFDGDWSVGGCEPRRTWC